MKNQNYVIAIDGYSSCGKSTLAKQLSAHLNFTYVDSGAMYRAITLHLLRDNVDINDIAAVENSLNSARVSFKQIDEQVRIFLNDEDVS
ncbi:MAG: cytidylate kinase, partial [Pedobacter sp.]